MRKIVGAENSMVIVYILAFYLNSKQIENGNPFHVLALNIDYVIGGIWINLQIQCRIIIHAEAAELGKNGMDDVSSIFS